MKPTGSTLAVIALLSLATVSLAKADEPSALYQGLLAKYDANKDGRLDAAEREAIRDVWERWGERGKEKMKGATIYVTLEPCSSFGRTPPCTEGILEVGITRVVYGTDDPNPSHAGGARKILEPVGVEVKVNVLQDACRSLIRGFAKFQTSGMPWVIIKSAMSLDGKITRPPGEGQWLTSPESREIVQRLRFESDAIMTGGNSFRIDNPALTLRSRLLPKKRQPWRMVVTRGSKSELPQTHQLFTDEYADRTLVCEGGDLRQALRDLAERGCQTVLVEAGGTLLAAMLREGLVDEVALFYAPLLTGGPNLGIGELAHDIALSEATFTQVGNDVLLRAYITPPSDYFA